MESNMETPKPKPSVPRPINLKKPLRPIAHIVSASFSRSLSLSRLTRDALDITEFLAPFLCIAPTSPDTLRTLAPATVRVAIRHALESNMALDGTAVNERGAVCLALDYPSIQP